MPAALGAFRHPNFRLFFLGQSVSMVGTWMQQIAVSWLVYRLTGSALLLGLVGFASNIAYLVVSPVAAIFADRYDRRQMLMAAQGVSSSLCALLAALTFLEIITAWQIIVIMLAIGVATEDCRASGTREVAAHASPTLYRAFHNAGDTPAGANDAPGLIGANAIHFRSAAIRRNTLAHSWHVHG